MRVTVLCALISASAPVALGNKVRLGAARDATITYTQRQNFDGSYTAYTPSGFEPLVMARQMATEVQRILLGFDMPPEMGEGARIQRCRLLVPKPIQRPRGEYLLTAWEAGNQWEERSVSAAAQVQNGEQLGGAVVRRGHDPHDIDVTRACQRAQAGRFSVFVDSNREAVAFYSRNSGKRSDKMFAVEVTFH
ncbi:hypothetical protein H4R23_002923 [Coemansia sp. Cherry 401B]|nr:hypothetical protein H4R23_002923 [Coemansia sp. Cherry 401B]